MLSSYVIFNSNLGKFYGTKYFGSELPQYNSFNDVTSVCISSPCLNGKCESSKHGYICSCEKGYSGTNCEIGEI